LELLAVDTDAALLVSVFVPGWAGVESEILPRRRRRRLRCAI
jgi:hypothetical protein